MSGYCSPLGAFTSSTTVIANKARNALPRIWATDGNKRQQLDGAKSVIQLVSGIAWICS